MLKRVNKKNITNAYIHIQQKSQKVALKPVGKAVQCGLFKFFLFQQEVLLRRQGFPINTGQAGLFQVSSNKNKQNSILKHENIVYLYPNYLYNEM